MASNSTFSAANEDLFSVGGGLANFTFDHVDAQAATGNRLLLVDGSNPATLNWTADESYLLGNMEVILGNTANVTLNNSIWTGASLDLTNLTINSSEWNLNANSTVTSDLINNGLINFVPNGNNFKTLTVNNYIGQAGTINLNTLLEGDGSPSDVLIINGGTATGSTNLVINNTDGDGELTTSNGILVVEALNGGTTDTGAFTLGNYVIAGPFEYRLYRGSVDGTSSENWYLRSEQISPEPDYRQEVSLYTSLPSMIMLYGRTLMDTLHRRVGEEQFSCGCSPTPMRGFWIRAIKESGHQHNGNIFHKGPNFNYNFSIVQLGLDLYRHDNDDGSRDYAGLLGAAGSGKGRAKHFDHETAGKNKFNAYTGGLYWTHYGSSGWYLDGVFETNWYSNVKAHSNRGPHLSTHGIEYAGSLEGGYPFKTCFCVLEPQAQVIYQSLSLNDAEDEAAAIDFKRTHSTLVRGGIRAANTWQAGFLSSEEPRLLTGWLTVNFWHDFQGNSKTSFSTDINPLSFTSELKGSWIQGDIGFTVQVTETVSFYGTLSTYRYLNNRGSAYNAIGGLKANF